MGMDIGIIGECEKDNRFMSMLVIAQNCEKLGIPYPDEVEEYFGGNPDASNGPRVDLSGAIEGDAMMGDGAVIHLDKIPKGVKKIIVQAGC